MSLYAEITYYCNMRSFLGLAINTANLSVYVFCDQLGKHLRQFGRFPRKLYLQIDGGPENMYKTLLGWSKLLVATRLVPEILLIRLHVGYTHEDIKDALFGHIGTSFRLNPCLTMSAPIMPKLSSVALRGNRKQMLILEDFYT